MNDKHRLSWMRGGVYNLTITTFKYENYMRYLINSITNWAETGPKAVRNWYPNDIAHGYYDISTHPERVNSWEDLP